MNERVVRASLKCKDCGAEYEFDPYIITQQHSANACIADLCKQRRILVDALVTIGNESPESREELSDWDVADVYDLLWKAHVNARKALDDVEERQK